MASVPVASPVTSLPKSSTATGVVYLPESGVGACLLYMVTVHCIGEVRSLNSMTMES